MRTYSVDDVLQAVQRDILGFYPEQWLADKNNVALINESKDVALFERQWYSGVTVCGHYFFHSRGKEARDAAKAFLKELFTGPYNVEQITGLTPVEHKGALWLTRQLGFTFHGDMMTDEGLHKFSLLTKEGWLKSGEMNE